jgi:hypothetical protein
MKLTNFSLLCKKARFFPIFFFKSELEPELELELVKIRNRNRTVTCQKSEPEPETIVTVPQHCL